MNCRSSFSVQGRTPSSITEVNLLASRSNSVIPKKSLVSLIAPRSSYHKTSCDFNAILKFWYLSHMQSFINCFYMIYIVGKMLVSILWVHPPYVIPWEHSSYRHIIRTSQLVLENPKPNYPSHYWIWHSQMSQPASDNVCIYSFLYYVLFLHKIS